MPGMSLGQVLGSTPCDSLSSMSHVIYLALVGLIGGTFGSMVGLGGGVFIIPALTLFLGVPIHQAIAASLVAVVATSTTAAAAYVRDDLSNMRLGMTMETMTVTGALVGSLVGVFGGVMIVVSVYMGIRQRSAQVPPIDDEDLGTLGASYYDRNLDSAVRYRVRRLPLGMGASFIAGNVSGLLGVGGGFLKVPAMVLFMGVPVRAAVSTSSFMIGVTACAGSVVYFARGMVDPVVTVPVVLGVSLGAYVGSRLALRIRSSVLAILLSAVLFALSVQMILSAVGINVR